jgi:hypothetical protein
MASGITPLRHPTRPNGHLPYLFACPNLPIMISEAASSIEVSAAPVATRLAEGFLDAAKLSRLEADAGPVGGAQLSAARSAQAERVRVAFSARDSGR